MRVVYRSEGTGEFPPYVHESVEQLQGGLVRMACGNEIRTEQIDRGDTTGTPCPQCTEFTQRFRGIWNDRPGQ